MIAALDVGTTKVTCFAAAREGEGHLRINGIGQEIARGLKAGVVTDMEAAELCVRTAVHRAETMCDHRIHNVFVSLSGGTPYSSYAHIDLEVGGREIEENHIHRAFDEAGTTEIGRDRDVVHAIATGFELDGNKGISDPKGLFGEKLRVSLHLVSVTHGSLRNLLTCVRRCDLNIAAPVISSYASGLACLVEDEMELGVTIVDMGGGATSMASFLGSAMIWTETLPLGGMHVTNDVARGLSTPLASAERMKRLFGGAIGGPSDERETIEVPQLGEAEQLGARQLPRSRLGEIIRPRLEEIFELVRERLDSSGVDSTAGRRIVLTGGASQMQGIGELAARVFDREVRLARPKPIEGLTQAFEGPAFATCAGLLHYAARNHYETHTRRRARKAATQQRTSRAFGRVGQWLRENF